MFSIRHIHCTNKSNKTCLQSLTYSLEMHISSFRDFLHVVYWLSTTNDSNPMLKTSGICNIWQSCIWFIENRATFRVCLSTWNSTCWTKSGLSSLSTLQCACCIHLMCFPGRSSAKPVHSADRLSLRWCPRGRKTTNITTSRRAVVSTDDSYTEYWIFNMLFSFESGYRGVTFLSADEGDFTCFLCWTTRVRKCLRCLQNRLISH